MTAGICNRLMSHLTLSGRSILERMIGGLNSSPDSRMPQYFIDVAG